MSTTEGPTIDLLVESGPRAGASWSMSRYPSAVGRSYEADFVIEEDPFLSRRHFQFRQDGAALWIEDLNSTSGVMVNGARVARMELSDGDRIRAGDSEFVVRFRAGAASASPVLLHVIQTERISPVEMRLYILGEAPSEDSPLGLPASFS